MKDSLLILNSAQPPPPNEVETVMRDLEDTEPNPGTELRN
jgi:hypothetical protein